MYKLYNGDCLEVMDKLIEEDIKVDCIICDLPYNTNSRKVTYNNWDNEIDLEKVWDKCNKIIKSDGAILLFGQGLFASKLINSNQKYFKYEWIWEKEQGTGFFHAKKRPLINYEKILVFYKQQPTYNPQMVEGKPYKTKKGGLSSNYGDFDKDKDIITKNKGTRYPLSIIKFKRDKSKFHPTQKPVDLLEYLIKTYTNENEVVLDFTAGSFSTGVACINSNRKFIGIELDKKFFDIGKKRMEEAYFNIQNEGNK